MARARLMNGSGPGVFARLREDVDCVFLRDPAARTRLEVLLTYPGVHALVWHRLAHALWRRGRRFSARLLSFVARLLTQIDIHPGAIIGRRFFIDHGCGVVIGETAEIGDDVTLYHGVTLGGVSWNAGKRHPTLADGVVVGAGAKILGPITVGRNARVGANSVVIENVAAGMTVVGIPGRVVLPLARRRVTEHGIDLDHHLMPDPVGKAISCLIERIHALECRVAEASSRPSLEPECKEPISESPMNRVSGPMAPDARREPRRMAKAHSQGEQHRRWGQWVETHQGCDYQMGSGFPGDLLCCSSLAWNDHATLLAPRSSSRKASFAAKRDSEIGSACLETCDPAQVITTGTNTH